MKLVWIAFAGGLGSLSRYGLSMLVHQQLGWKYPWGTTAVNVLGCFLFGLIWATTKENTWLTPETRTVILVGFMGAFTTFSTFIFEIDNLLRDQRYLTAGIDLLVQVALGLGLLVCGIRLGKYLIS